MGRTKGHEPHVSCVSRQPWGWNRGTDRTGKRRESKRQTGRRLFFFDPTNNDSRSIWDPYRPAIWSGHGQMAIILTAVSSRENKQQTRLEKSSRLLHP